MTPDLVFLCPLNLFLSNELASMGQTDGRAICRLDSSVVVIIPPCGWTLLVTTCQPALSVLDLQTSNKDC